MRRREILLSSLPFTAALLLKANSEPLPPQDFADEPFDQETYEFWTSQVDQPSNVFEEHGHLVSSRGTNLPSEADFLFYSKETGFVRAASTSSDTDVTTGLLDNGDASLVFTVDTIRPAAAYMQKLCDQKNGSLRIDIKQAVPLQQLSETLNWSAIASLYPGGAPCGYRELTFDPKSTWGQAKKVPLTGGLGFWSWNFSTQPKPSFWAQMMGMISGASPSSSGSSQGSAGSNGSSGASSDTASAGISKVINSSGVKKAKAAATTIMGIGFPAVAKTALGAFNQIFGSMMAKGSPKTEWIIHNADTPMMATKAARQKYPGHAVALRSGAYLVVSTEDAQKILSGKYELNDGSVVPAGTSTADLNDAAKTTLTDVSYIALSTSLESIS